MLPLTLKILEVRKKVMDLPAPLNENISIDPIFKELCEVKDMIDNRVRNIASHNLNEQYSGIST